MLAITYVKDGSVSRENDSISFTYNCTQTEFGDIYYVSADECEPTCEEAVVCSYCQTVVKEMLGHDMVTYGSQTPTCTEIGWEEYGICDRCGHSTYSELPALGHSFGEWSVTQAPTCFDDGVKEHSCVNCGIIETGVIDALGHPETLTRRENIVDATCTTDGGYDLIVYCSTCNHVISAGHKIVYALGHELSDEWIINSEPTCEKSGSKYQQCTRCAELYNFTELPALGHKFGSWVETQAPTCTNGGIRERVCEICSLVETDLEPMFGHSASEKVYENVIDPTCEDYGSFEYVVYCDVCGEELNRYLEYVDPLGHSFTNYVSNNDATYDSDGTKTANCDRCDMTDTVVDEGTKLGYDLKFKELVENLEEETDLSRMYSELYYAMHVYSTLSETEKENVTDEFDTLKEMIREYNESAKVINKEHADATKFAFTSLTSTGFVFISALWYLLRRIFKI